MDPTTHFLTIRTNSFADRIRNRATALRRAADELDRIADRAATVGTPEFTGARMSDNLAWHAHDVQHAVLSVLASLSLDSLTVDAHDVDSLREASK